MKRKASASPAPVAQKGKKIAKTGGGGLMFQDRPSAGKEEKKNIDVNTAATIVAATATFSTMTHINPIQQGATANNRLGREANMRSLHYRWQGSFAPTTAGSSPIRLLIVYDKQPNGAAPPILDILIADAIESPMNLDWKKRFIILVDQEVECVGAQGPSAWYIKGNRKMALNAEFTGVGGGIASLNSGSVYAITYQNGNIITAAPTSQLYTRIRFTD